jgi:hypothetical protein
MAHSKHSAPLCYAKLGLSIFLALRNKFQSPENKKPASKMKWALFVIRSGFELCFLNILKNN